MRYNKRYLRLTLYPKSQCGFLVEALISTEMGQTCWRKLSFSSGIDTFFGNYLTWVDIRIVLYNLEYFHSFLIFRHWALLKTRIRGFHANFHFAALTSPLQLLLVLCPPPLSFELASSALCWLVVSVAPQIEHMFDLRSTRSTPFKYRAPVATWDRLHI